MVLCKIESCGQNSRARGMCSRHYMAERRSVNKTVNKQVVNTLVNTTVNKNEVIEHEAATDWPTGYQPNNIICGYCHQPDANPAIGYHTGRTDGFNSCLDYLLGSIH